MTDVTDDAPEAETDVPEALVPQLAQLKAQRANAVAYGQTDIVAAVDRQLDALGIELSPSDPAEDKDSKDPKDPEDSKEPKGTDNRDSKGKVPEVPQGRTPVNPKQTTAEPDKAK